MAEEKDPWREKDGDGEGPMGRALGKDPVQSRGQSQSPLEKMCDGWGTAMGEGQWGWGPRRLQSI